MSGIQNSTGAELKRERYHAVDYNVKPFSVGVLRVLTSREDFEKGFWRDWQMECVDCAFMSMYDLCYAPVQRLGEEHGSPDTGGSWSDVRAVGDC